MKTLKKFQNAIAEVKMQMTSPKDTDYFNGIYKIVEKPRKKNSDWKEEVAYYDNVNDANNDFRGRILFWIR